MITPLSEELLYVIAPQQNASIGRRIVRPRDSGDNAILIEKDAAKSQDPADRYTGEPAAKSDITVIVDYRPAPEEIEGGAEEELKIAAAGRGRAIDSQRSDGPIGSDKNAHRAGRWLRHESDLVQAVERKIRDIAADGASARQRCRCIQQQPCLAAGIKKHPSRVCGRRKAVNAIFPSLSMLR